MANYVCPETRRPLTPLTQAELTELNDRVNQGALASAKPLPPSLEGALGTEDRAIVYPVMRDIPVLMPGAGIFSRAHPSSPTGSTAVRLAAQVKDIETEAALYDKIALEGSRDPSFAEFGEELRPGVPIKPEFRDSFPRPGSIWLDAFDSLTAQEKAYEWIAPLEGRRVLQMGGHGSHAVKFLLAGAAEAQTLSPSFEELVLGRSLSEKFGVSERFRPVQGIAEQFPYPDNAFDAIYGGGCLHHTMTEYSSAEVLRILRPGGLAAFVEPRMTPWYRLGRRLFSSRGLDPIQSQARDRPLLQREIDGLSSLFSVSESHPSRVFFHIPLVVMSRFLKIKLPPLVIRRIEELDSKIVDLFPFVRSAAPIVSICLRK
jgi:uncharacterized protein YbaR (Trm112 family)/SAM-dependent methyltransferase